MKCLKRICIYQTDGFCTNTEEIEIDWHGMCKNMILARITNRYLDECKEYTRMALKNDYFFDNEKGMVTMTESVRENRNKVL